MTRGENERDARDAGNLTSEANGGVATIYHAPSTSVHSTGLKIINTTAIIGVTVAKSPHSSHCSDFER